MMMDDVLWYLSMAHEVHDLSLWRHHLLQCIAPCRWARWATMGLVGQH